MTGRHHFPTHDEMLALDQAARRARTREFARLLRAAARRLKALVAHGAAALARNKARPADAPARRAV